MKTVARFLDTRLVVQGWSWLPGAELLTWLLASWWAGRHRPERTLAQRLGMGALLMPLILGLEWGHNLAHAAAACLVHRPLDAMRVVFGMPLLIYQDVNDPRVTPVQHLVRTLGGPLFNTVMLIVSLLFRRRTRPGTPARELADAAVNTNKILAFAGYLPVPMLDGGPLLKWSLVMLGQSPVQADTLTRRANWLVAPVLALLGGRELRRRRWWLGLFLLQMSGLALAVALGKLDENSSSFIGRDLTA